MSEIEVKNDPSSELHISLGVVKKEVEEEVTDHHSHRRRSHHGKAVTARQTEQSLDSVGSHTERCHRNGRSVSGSDRPRLRPTCANSTSNSASEKSLEGGEEEEKKHGHASEKSLEGGEEEEKKHGHHRRRHHGNQSSGGHHHHHHHHQEPEEPQKEVTEEEIGESRKLKPSRSTGIVQKKVIHKEKKDKVADIVAENLVIKETVSPNSNKRAHFRRRTSCPTSIADLDQIQTQSFESDVIDKHRSSSTSLQNIKTKKSSRSPADTLKIKIKPHPSNTNCPYTLIAKYFNFTSNTTLRTLSNSLWHCLSVMIPIHEAIEISILNDKKPIKIKNWEQSLQDIFQEYQKDGNLKLCYDVLPREKCISLKRTYYGKVNKEDVKLEGKVCHLCQKKPKLLSHHKYHCDLCNESVCETCSDEIHSLWAVADPHDCTPHNVHHYTQQRQQKLVRVCKHCKEPRKALENPFDLLSETLMERIGSLLTPIDFVGWTMGSKRLHNLSKNSKLLDKTATYNLRLLFPGIPYKSKVVKGVGGGQGRSFSESERTDLADLTAKAYPQWIPVELTVGYSTRSLMGTAEPYTKTEVFRMLVHRNAAMRGVFYPMKAKIVPWKWDLKGIVIVVGGPDTSSKERMMMDDAWLDKSVGELTTAIPKIRSFLDVEFLLVSSISEIV